MEEHYYSFIKEELEDFSQFHSFTNSQFLYTVYFDVEEYADVLKEYDFLHEKSYAFGFFNEKFNDEWEKSDGKISSTITTSTISTVLL